jgi:alcohol dehydrogenase (cytochrome c)
MYGDWLYFMTPDCWFLSLNAKTGKERWRKKIADEKLQYFCTMSPLVVKNHILVGVGGDAMDVPGFPGIARSRDRRPAMALEYHPSQGRTRRRHLAQSASHGTRRRHDLDARHLRSRTEPHLLGHGKSQSRFRRTGPSRRQSLDGIHRGPRCRYRQAQVWYHQPSPHDTHDWDNVETPVLFDGAFNGQPRKMLAQAARNGIFTCSTAPTARA